MPPLVDITSHRFGKLVAIKVSGRKWGKVVWLCRCDCGVFIKTTSNSLRMKNTTSCGCVRIQHGHCRDARQSGVSRTYDAWHAMLQRCGNPGSTWFHRYGGRGIAVCERWRIFANFLDDMGDPPDGRTLDRIDGDGDYEPGNCRWATAREQTINRSATKLTPDLVQEIHGRREHGESPKSIAVRVKVSRRHIDHILSGRKWRGSSAGYQ